VCRVPHVQTASLYTWDDPFKLKRIRNDSG